jgi:hypothetical protein
MNVLGEAETAQGPINSLGSEKPREASEEIDRLEFAVRQRSLIAFRKFCAFQKSWIFIIFFNKKNNKN